MQSVWPSVLVFLLVIAAIPAAAWLLRRGQSFGARGNASLGVAGAVAVGPRERIALVRVEARGDKDHTRAELAQHRQAPAFEVTPDCFHELLLTLF